MMPWLAALSVGAATFVVVVSMGEWLMSRRRVWRPVGLQHGDHATWIPPDIAPYLQDDYPGVRVETPWGTVVYHDRVTSP